MGKDNQMPDNIIKIVQVMGFLLNLDDNHKLNRVKLMKLVWAADRTHLRRYGRTVSGDEYYAMRFGPVPSLAYDIAKISNNDYVFDQEVFDYLSEYFISNDQDTAMVKSPGTDYLSETDRSVLKEAWDKFGEMDAFDMANDVSHSYPEWAKFSEFFNSHRGGRVRMDILDFFDNPKRDLYFSEDAERLEAAKNTFSEHSQIQAALVGA